MIKFRLILLHKKRATSLPPVVHAWE